MTDHVFDQLIRLHEMGQAYKVITENMGPSFQLIAFVNYDKIDNGNFGLESFDITSQHTRILSDIESNHALELACEGFLGKLLGINNKNEKEPALIGNTRKLEVHKLEFFYILLLQFTTHFEFEQKTLQRIPSDYKENSWKAFDHDVEQRRQKVLKTLNGITLPKGITDKVSIEQSGWTKDLYHKERDFLLKAVRDHNTYFTKPFSAETEVLKGWIATKGEDNKAVVKYMHSSIGVAPMGYSIHDLMAAVDVINGISPYFDSE